MDVLAFVFRTIEPSFNTVAVLLVFAPISLVLGSVYMGEGSFAMSLVVLPESYIDISISVNQSTEAVGLIVLKPSLIHRAVNPDLKTLAFSDLRSFNP